MILTSIERLGNETGHVYSNKGTVRHPEKAIKHTKKKEAYLSEASSVFPSLHLSSFPRPYSPRESSDLQTMSGLS